MSAFTRTVSVGALTMTLVSLQIKSWADQSVTHPYSVQTQDRVGQCLANPKPILCTDTGQTRTMPGKP